MATRDERPAGRTAALVAAASIVCTLVLATYSDGPAGASAMLPVAQMIAFTLILGAAVLHYFSWRVSSVERPGDLDVRLSGWLTIGLVLGASHGLVLTVTAYGSWQLERAHWPYATLLVILGVLFLMTLVSERVDVPGDPALLGGAAGSLLVVASSAVPRLAPPAPSDATSVAVSVTAVVLAACALVWSILQRRTVDPRVRRQLATAVALLTAGELAFEPGLLPVMVTTAATAAQVAAALMICSMTQGLLRGSINEREEQVTWLQRSLAEVREAEGKDRELLHEVGSTLAGIASASRVMRQGTAVPASRRRRLESMLDAELERLERLMDARASGPRTPGDAEVELDEVIEPLVVSHHARGRDVRWFPSHERAFTDPDDLAELVNILLENAARHGGRGPVRLSVTAADGGALVMCSDSGPGVAPEVRDHLFESEVRSSTSPGQGLGLAIAHRLATDRGGCIELVEDHHAGATFVARLPRRSAVDVVCNIA
ncbi:sensor histidine kinase [Nocardioides halotolerans]|uniref:sensor histidine kinase n=1 Tax=Nocardioides halotolerans TaxID=433660 RepID=UPI00146EF615|nr:HAMP domain-containing sensor histidine kinase [Nocardioides halotolerans]